MGKQKACWQTQRPKVLKGMLAKPKPENEMVVDAKTFKKKDVAAKGKKSC